MQKINIQRYDLDCGMPVFVERNDGVKSVGMTWVIPYGSALDEIEHIGASTILSEWILRGAGDLDARQHSDALERLGVQRSCRMETYHVRLSAALIGNSLHDALPLLTSIILKPQLTDSHFEYSRELALQVLDGLQDEPQQRAMLLVKEKHFPAPFNRSGLGEADDIRNLTPEYCKSIWGKYSVPRGSIMTFSGDIDGDKTVVQLNELLHEWQGELAEPEISETGVRGYHHVKEETAQVHIGLAHSAPPEPDENSMIYRIGTAVLSGGMSGRLFTEVRERRSLCYSVNASYVAGRDRGALMAYAGTTPQRAQETLDVTLGEIQRMRAGVSQDEFNRATVGLKSRLVMHGESTSARAGSIAHDQFLIGRTRSLEEITDTINRITLAQVNDYLAGLTYDDFTIVTVGPEALAVPE